MKKQDLNNVVIELLDEEHGKRVKTFWLKVFPENNEDINNYAFDCTKKGDDILRYYGYIDGGFDNYDKPDLSFDSTIILTLEQAEEIWAKEQQPKLTFPRKMIVSDNHDFSSSSIELVYGIFSDRDRYPVIGKTANWGYAKELLIEPEPEVIEISLDEAKEELAKLYNCTVEQISILI